MPTALDLFNAVKNPFFKARDFKKDVDALQNENQIAILSSGAKILYQRNPTLFVSYLAIPTCTITAGIASTLFGGFNIKNGHWIRGFNEVITGLAAIAFARRKVVDITSSCAAEGYYDRINTLMDKHLGDVLKAEKIEELKAKAHDLVGQGRLDGVGDLLHDGVTSVIKNVAERQVDDKLGNILPNN